MLTSDDEATLCAALPGISTGYIHALAGIAEHCKADGVEILTEEDMSVDALYFVLDGGVRMEKAGEGRLLPTGTFIGEVAYLLGQEASATVKVGHGTRYLRWDVERLHSFAEKSESFRSSLEAALNRDLAAKVARAL